MTATTVYVWLTGQHDNIGDSILRREYARSLRSLGPIKVWAGDVEEGYISGLGLAPSELCLSFWRWYLAFARSAISGRGVFAFNAGEFVITKGYLVGLCALLPWIVASRLTSGRLIWLGASVRSTIPVLSWPFRVLAAMATDLRWRDSRSSDVFGRFAMVMPDWAFAVPYNTVGRVEAEDGLRTGGRDLLAVSMRGDRPSPDREWLSAVGRAATTLGLRLVIVVQVRRDSARATVLADHWGCELVPWKADAHFEQEKVVREVYRQSSVIISDRLHALIVAATEGAVPLAWTSRPAPKISAHFDATEMRGVARDGAYAIDSLRELDDEAVRRLQRELESAMARAHNELRLVDASLSSPGSTGG